MDNTTDTLRLMKQNYSQDIIYFERLAEKETGKHIELHVENENIVMYHKVTGSNKGIYTPSADFVELASTFTTLQKAGLYSYELEAIKTVFAKHGIKRAIF